MPLLFLSMFTISVEVLLFKSHQEKRTVQGFLCFFISLFSLLSLFLSPSPFFFIKKNSQFLLLFVFCPFLTLVRKEAVLVLEDEKILVYVLCYSTKILYSENAE